MIDNPTIRELYKHMRATPVPVLAKDTGNILLYESLLAGQASRAAEGELLTEPITTLDQVTIDEIEKIQSKNQQDDEEKELLVYVELLKHVEHFLLNIKFVGDLIGKVPELQPVLDEHIHENDDPLPYVFMGAVRDFMLSEERSNRLEPHQPAARILEFIEGQLKQGGEYMQGFVHASFTDNFPDESSVLQKLEPLIGPLLRQQLKDENKIR